MADKKKSNGEQREAQRIIDRVERETESLGLSSLARTAEKTRDHFTGADAPDDDPVEIWGRRVGRAFSLIAFIVLAIWLYNYLTR